jgi:UDPglucose 6-dehydrogenase
MKIIVAGYGFVGKAVANVLKEHHQAVIVDPQYTSTEIQHHPDADGIIVCVNTPTGDNGIIVENIANVIDQVPIHIPILIKSTVTPGVVDILNEIYPEHSICYSPEFLRARTANQDFINQKYAVVGGDDPECFWQELLLEILPNCTMIMTCTEHEACLIKYSANSFLALKTSFFNQIFDICEKTNMNFDIVRHILTQDSRIGAGHTLVPGPDGLRGWGGHCFPKDTEAFVHWAKHIDAVPSLVESAIDYNKKVRNNS